MNFIPCLAWVPKGAAKTEPYKLKLEPEELKEIIQQTKEDYREICDKDDLSEEDLDQGESSHNQCNKKSQSESNSHEDKRPSKKAKLKKNDEDDDEFNKRYNLDDYDEDDTDNPIFTINDIAVYADNEDDNYITSKDIEDEDELEEEEDFKIKSSDNLLVAGRVEDDRSLLEIYVYNDEEDSFYVHHDIVLPAFPLALEWLDYHAEDEKGNYLAVGDMTPVIKVWDLDVVDILEPDYKLGKAKPLKKNSLKKGHTDAVLSLSWNKCLRERLGSGSADSTICIWDLQQKTIAQRLHNEASSSEDNKVQALHWNPNKSSLLLSGNTNGSINLYDITDTNSSIKTWTFKGEVEKVTWHLKDEYKFFCAVTLSDGSSELSYIDLRNDHKYTCFGHSLAITGLDFSLHSNVLMTTGMDKQMKLWKLNNKDEIELLKSQKLKIGSIYSSKVNPDLDCIVAVGGDNKSNNLKVINIMKNNECSAFFENTKEES